MKTNLEMFRTNDKYVEEGKWVQVSLDTSFLIRPINDKNPKAKAAVAAHYAPYAAMIKLGTLPEEKAREILVKVFVDSCLMDWKGVEVDGKEIPFSKEEAYKVLIEFPAIHKLLSEYASDESNFRVELGNS